MERESLCGSAYKRLALLEENAGRPRQELKAITNMLERYARAEEIGRRDRLEHLLSGDEPDGRRTGVVTPARGR